MIGSILLTNGISAKDMGTPVKSALYSVVKVSALKYFSISGDTVNLTVILPESIVIPEIFILFMIVKMVFSIRVAPGLMC